MRPYMFVVIGTLLSLAFSAPQGGRAHNELDGTLTTTLSATLSFTFTSTHVVTLPTISSFTTTSSTSKPTYTATEIYAVRPGAPFHMIPFQAAGGVFRLGGGNAAYCPLYAEKLGACEARTNITGINGCSLSTVVPGGQSIYLAPDGELKYTPPHSAYMVPGSISCPLSYTEVRDSDASEVRIAGFGATSFMACPMLTTTRVKQQWQVYANTLNASTPLRHENDTTCWVFEAVGVEKQLSHFAATWEYV
ncbi:hypothetical protein LTR05_001019 [Lithohypha guttulata]|uniref:Ig-like domain-containing protein n=1 Tax=Lithohypha guttulata TaxID=1690604 RepID=A0AAN7YEK5_9EURO|nr:hypothetical protein LTR05_001019 [Lithohypha guttulata]